MTATRPDVRARLTETAQAAARDMPFDAYCPRDPDRPLRDCPECIALVAADAITPLVDRLVAEGQARALREAADRLNGEAHRLPVLADFASKFRARADALHTEDTP